MSDDNCAFLASLAKWEGRGSEWECVNVDVGGVDLNDLFVEEDDGDAALLLLLLLFGEPLLAFVVEDRLLLLLVVLPRSTPNGEPMTLPIPLLLGEVDDDDDDVCPLLPIRPLLSLAPPLALPLFGPPPPLPPPPLPLIIPPAPPPPITSPIPCSPAHE